MNLALLQVESALADIAQSAASTFWLWFTAGAFILATAWFIYLSSTGRPGQYHHYVASTVITFWAALWYIVMASGSGISLVTEGGETRLFYYARYIDWTITTPLLLLGLVWIAVGGRLSRAPALAAGIVVADVAMILTGVAAGATGSNFKWFWFVVSTIFFLIVLALLWGPVRAQLSRYEPEGGPRLWYTLAGLLTVLWILYPIVFIIGTEGVGAVSSSVEIFFYAVLDILAKIAFGAILLGGIRGQAPSSVLGGRQSGGGQGRASRVS